MSALTRNVPGELLQAAVHEAGEPLVGLRRDLAGIIAAADGATDDEHDPEGTTAFERAQVQSLVDATLQQLRELGAAAERVRDGSYGICAVCGAWIDPARLAVRAVARTCVGCVPIR